MFDFAEHIMHLFFPPEYLVKLVKLHVQDSSSKLLKTLIKDTHVI